MASSFLKIILYNHSLVDLMIQVKAVSPTGAVLPSLTNGKGDLDGCQDHMRWPENLDDKLESSTIKPYTKQSDDEPFRYAALGNVHAADINVIKKAFVTKRICNST